MGSLIFNKSTKIRHCWLVILLVGAQAWAQSGTTPAAPSDSHVASAAGTVPEKPTPTVAPDAAVVTIKGLCSKPSAASAPGSSPDASCETIITRAQFEELTDAMQPGMTPPMKIQFAAAYPKLLAMAKAAEDRGLEKGARYQRRLEFARVQILSQELLRQLQDESANPPQAEIEDYYQKNIASYQQATLERIFIPIQKATDQLPSGKSTPAARNAQHEAAEEAMTREAELLHKRAIAGEKFPQLQNEAYKVAGLDEVPPSSSLGQVPRSTLPADHAAVFDLKPGEVSPIFSDSTGHFIYKLDALNLQPLDAVKNQISKTLQRQYVEKTIQSIQGPITSDSNPAYFGQVRQSDK